jgi:signal transduction histidine kinase
MGDAMRLQQVFWNLLRNAIKFTPQGGRIDVSTANVPTDFVQIIVADTGIGIDCEKISLIFDAFEQGSTEIQERFGGMGLGLAICRALVLAHRGSITVQSPGVGAGAAFTVRLPTSSQRSGGGGSIS